MAKKQELTSFLKWKCWILRKITCFMSLWSQRCLSDFSFFHDFSWLPVPSRSLLLARQATLSTLCCILVVDIHAVALILWTSPLSCVHVLIMMATRSISTLSWLSSLRSAKAFGSRELQKIFSSSHFFFSFCQMLAWTSHISGGGGRNLQHIHKLSGQGWKRNWVVSSTNGLHTCFEIQAELQIQ